MNLTELRKQWEKGLDPVLTIPILIGNFQKVLVVLSKKDKTTTNYGLYRYFQLNGEWQISVDCRCEHKLDYILQSVEGDRDKIELNQTLNEKV